MRGVLTTDGHGLTRMGIGKHSTWNIQNWNLEWEKGNEWEWG
jgi:hypothetical protein